MRDPKHPRIWTVVFAILSVAYLFPIVLVVINSFKGKVFVSSEPFSLPNPETFVGWENYAQGIAKTDFVSSFGWSLVITIGSAALILLCTSMTAWWIVRADNRFAKSIYLVFLFNLVVPFQMVMFTLSWLVDYLGLGNPFGLWIVYLGFGAGLAVFIFTGFVKGIPVEIEEAATIDGCGPVRTFFNIVLPIMKPAVVTVAILEVMWLWNDYLLPYLSLDLKKYKTVPIAVQYLKGGYGSVDMGAMMGVLVLAMIPVIVFYAFSQKHIIKGVVAGAVKG
ncbi:carbohydrate ABC transporter permease [Tessaracoccus sp. HDW20]|uniref:carbohydrate ABC transporter permease n=1 Tax=Tessaracoccus coleopterorum TaxID=2714950 RepID=UPI0018D462C8|nr:carbohydrate ABC transporter permease [Tessaracoccus coleopterorum]NHB85362.1 carbohydrate ABC transporter permease [Tessaracoccus coleopterorum]